MDPPYILSAIPESVPDLHSMNACNTDAKEDNQAVH